MLTHNESTECKAPRLERLDRNESISRKTQLLEQLDSEREIELEDTFTYHLADAIRASSQTERQQAVDNATEAYEDALDGMLYEILDKRFADEASSTIPSPKMPERTPRLLSDLGDRGYDDQALRKLAHENRGE